MFRNCDQYHIKQIVSFLLIFDNNQNKIDIFDFS